MKLNLAKCGFGIKVGKFLGFMESTNGIEPNPKKLKALMNMSLLRTLKEVHIPTERIAALNRFISKMADNCLSFFKSLCNITDFE